MQLDVRAISRNIGAEIRGVDLSKPIAEDAMAEIKDVWFDKAVVVFPEQDIDDEQHIAFTRKFGELEMINMSALQSDARPEIYEATNLDSNNNFRVSDDPVMVINRGNQKWHSDSSFKAIPANGSMLHAYIVPGEDEGGETEFANMAAAYDALDDDVKAKCDDLVCVHDFYWSRRDVQERAFTQEERDAIPPVRHPLIRVHPDSGRKAIYVGSHAREIEGMDFDEGRALIEFLIAHGTKPEFTYQHKWKVGDVVLWDNRTALHRGMAFDDSKVKRRLHRTTLAGDGPTL